MAEDTKRYGVIGTHGGVKKGKAFARPASKQTKLHQRAAARLEQFEKNPPKIKDPTKPGSRSWKNAGR